MNYIVNLFAIFSGTTQLLIGHNRMSYVLLLLSGVALASILWLLCAFFGRLFYKPYRLSIGQHILCSLLAVMVTLTVPIYASAEYLQPGLAGIIAHWRDTLASSKAWNDTQFKLQYHEIKKMGIEDFSIYPAPEQGGQKIPMNHMESRVKTSQMTAEAAIENFNFNFPLLSKTVGTNATVSADMINKDVNNYIKANPGVSYPTERGVQLAANQISTELEPQLPRVISMIHLILILKIVFGYVICLSWIAYAALRQIRVHSAHTLLSSHP
jgi:hypothetical protein